MRGSLKEQKVIEDPDDMQESSVVPGHQHRQSFREFLNRTASEQLFDNADKDGDGV